MLTEYVDAAMRKAKYEKLDDQEGYAATIRGCRGVIGYGRTLKACRVDLREALEGWIIIKLWHNHNNLPVLAGINLNFKTKKSKVA